MYLGIDLGTSSVKVLLVDHDQRIRAQSEIPLSVERPRPLWSEQDPEAWCAAVNQAMASIRADHGAELNAVRGIGLSGQMHGGTLLDRTGRVLRPAILWNDGRSVAECAELERREPATRVIAANPAMPGFTAPKLLWVARHEPDVFANIAHVLLPKDYLRYRMTGQFASDMSDSAGTLWLDVARRCWSDRMLSATGLTETMMPELYEGSNATGTLLPAIADHWGVPATAVVAAGAGDNAAAAIGLSIASAGQGLISFGTSGVSLEVDGAFRQGHGRSVHTFCHALPNRWLRMAVMLSAAGSLAWLARVTGVASVAELLIEAEQAGAPPNALFFLPYLSGERVPPGEPSATGGFTGLTEATSRGDLARAVLEGVAFGLADGQAALHPNGAPDTAIPMVGGGARSRFWSRIVADALCRKMLLLAESQAGAAYGAARLGRLAAGGEDEAAVCTAPAQAEIVEPNPGGHTAERLARFRALYRLASERCGQDA
jgi:xylulokinase